MSGTNNQAEPGKRLIGRDISRRGFLINCLAIGGSISAGALLQACGSPSGSSPSSATPGTGTTPGGSPAAAKGGKVPTGKVVVVVGEESNTLASHEAMRLSGHTVLRNVQEALLNRDPKTNELVGELATKWEQVDELTWRFHLRKGVKFHDGSPFTAEVAAFGINHTFSKENNFPIRQFLGPEMEAKATDEYTVDVKTASPDPILPSRLYFCAIPSMKAFKEKPDEYATKPIGTGPYKFVEWVRGQHIKLEANPDWWGQSAEDAHGALTIKEVTILGPRPEREVRAAMVRTGEADIARWISAELCSTSAKCERVTTVETLYIGFDMTNSTKDKRIREAVAYAIDKEAIVDGILGGGTVAAQMVGPSALGFNRDLKPYPYDPEKAKSLVAAAKADGVEVDAPLTVYVRAGVLPGIDEVGEALAGMISAVGLNVKARVLERSAFNEMNLASAGGKPVPEDRGMLAINPHGNELMDYGVTVNAFYRCGANYARYCDKTLTEMDDKARALSGEARDKAYQEIAKYALEQLPMVPIGHLDGFYGLSKRIDWKPRLDGFMLFKEMTITQ